MLIFYKRSFIIKYLNQEINLCEQKFIELIKNYYLMISFEIYEII